MNFFVLEKSKYNIKMANIIETYIFKHEESINKYQKLFYLNLIENISYLNNLDYLSYIKIQLDSFKDSKICFRLQKKFLLLIDSEAIINSKAISEKDYLLLWLKLRKLAFKSDYYKLKVNSYEYNIIRRYFFDAILFRINSDINKDTYETAYKLYKDNKLKKFSYYLEIAKKL